ncbi:MAG: hypothetical protein DI549_06790 [Ancylobacter novellus]|uniref:Uncharacterized protein n=1 Tax=Ancylobacter novellus TaxID=921 RepID=A0A2W5RAE4_ANCNO|nr:MAG: hypothetical protein DI549_06790 [Ancylobacter novellus]
MGRSADRANPPVAEAEIANAEIANAEIANAMTAILLHSEAIRQHMARGTDAPHHVDDSTRHIVSNARRIWARLDETDAPPPAEGA